MKVNRKFLAIGAAIAALGAGGVGIAQAVGGGGSDEKVSGPDAEKAKSAALQAVGGGTVTDVERQEGKGAGGFEVEVKRGDGSQVGVRVDDRYRAVEKTSDDESASEAKDQSGSESKNESGSESKDESGSDSKDDSGTGSQDESGPGAQDESGPGSQDDAGGGAGK